jgi:hypothetical protein
MSDFIPFQVSGFADQADGLRRLFAGSRQRVLPVVSNPHAPSGGWLLDRLMSAFDALGAATLAVDAAEGAQQPSELAAIDLSACIEPLGASGAYLAARGLPMRHVDARGSTAGFLTALANAAPQYEIVLLHAAAPDLARLCGRREMLRPILLADERLESVTHAYAGLKLLSQRCNVAVFDLLVAGHEGAALATRIAERIGSCADRFIGAAVHEVAIVGPTARPDAPPPACLLRLAAAQLAIDHAAAAAAAPARHPAAPAAAAFQR